MASLDDVIERITPREVTVRVPVRGDLVGRIRALQAEIGDAVRVDQMSNTPDTAPALRAELDQLTADYQADAVAFTFRGVTRSEWLELMRSCPPTDEDRALGFDYNPETFPAVAMAATLVEPDGVTEAKVRQLAETMSNGPFQRLWEACMAANVAVEDEMIPFTAAAIGAILDSAPSSTTAAAEGSPTGSSPGE